MNYCCCSKQAKTKTEGSVAHANHKMCERSDNNTKFQQIPLTVKVQTPTLTYPCLRSVIVNLIEKIRRAWHRQDIGLGIVCNGGREKSKLKFKFYMWFHGLVVRTLDSESSNPSSNLGGTFLWCSFWIFLLWISMRDNVWFQHHGNPRFGSKLVCRVAGFEPSPFAGIVKLRVY